MPRILYGYGATVGWLVVATMHVTAQQPGTSAAPAPRSTVARAAPARPEAPRILPGTRSNAFGTIQGNALNSTNRALTDAIVRLRDARAGQIIGTKLTDSSGLFEFSELDPGSYVVELVDQQQNSVLAASQILDVGPGEALSAIVKLPFRVPPLAGVLGNSTPSAAVVMSQAASAGVLATQVSGAPTCDNLQP
jgi:hypothetical protein